MPLASVTWPSWRFFTSCASQRLVVVSSFSTWAKVLSFSWSGRHWRRASLALGGGGGGEEEEEEEEERVTKTRLSRQLALETDGVSCTMAPNGREGEKMKERSLLLYLQ